ncbi:MAG: hypothetical protein ABI697_12745 [Devosia sp.]
MAVKRRVSKTVEHRITAAALDAFRAGDETALHKALGLKPWHPSPLDDHNPYPPGAAASLTWPMIVELRSALQGGVRRSKSDA